MNDIFQVLEQALGTSKEVIILLLTGLGGLILSAKEWRIGIIGALLLFSVEFVGFYFLGWNYLMAFALVVFCMVLLIVSIFTSYEKGQIF